LSFGRYPRRLTPRLIRRVTDEVPGSNVGTCAVQLNHSAAE
jgi:hypothetical protein